MPPVLFNQERAELGGMISVDDDDDDGNDEEEKKERVLTLTTKHESSDAYTRESCSGGGEIPRNEVLIHILTPHRTAANRHNARVTVESDIMHPPHINRDPSPRYIRRPGKIFMPTASDREIRNGSEISGCDCGEEEGDVSCGCGCEDARGG